MSDEQKELLFNNTAANIGPADKHIQIRHIVNCYKADPAYGKGVAAALKLSWDEVEKEL